MQTSRVAASDLRGRTNRSRDEALQGTTAQDLRFVGDIVSGVGCTPVVTGGPRRHCPPHGGGEAPLRAAGPGAARSDGSLLGSGWKRSEFTEHCLHAARERLDVPRSISLRHLPYRLPEGITACPGVGLELLRVGGKHLVER